MESSHRLAAIMFTDIVGYTALMGENEETALNLLSKNRAIHKSMIARYDGKWLKEMGDGTLASFNSSTDAVRCANEIQSYAEKESIALRLGIHVGEVVFENKDVFGDGVNIASRIQALAPSGGIWVSESVHKTLINKKGIETTFIKEAQLKNVREPVRIYEVKVENIEAASVPIHPVESIKTNQQKILLMVAGVLAILALGYFGISFFRGASQPVAQNIEKSIAVLPFKNDSPNDENVYFCNGIMEGILDHLSKIPDLSVASRTSVEQYRENPPSAKEIAKALGVNYILEGSVLRIGNRSKITAQLIYAPEDRHLWSDQFDKELEDIFLVLSEVTETIADELKAKISPDLLERIESVPTTNVAAYDYYLQGKEYLNGFEFSRQEGDLNNAEKLYRYALGIDSTFALAYAGLAHIHWERNQFNFYKDENSVDTVLQLCNKAIALDPTAADAYWIRGAFYDHIMIEIDKAEHDLKKAIELNPSHVEARENLALLLAFHRRDYVSGLKMLRMVENIDRSPDQLAEFYLHECGILYTIGYFEKYIHSFRKAKEVNPLLDNSALVWLNMAQCNFREMVKLAQEFFDPNSQIYLIAMVEGHFYLGEYDLVVTYWEKLVNMLNEEEPKLYNSITDGHYYGYALVKAGRVQEGIKIMKDQLKKNDQLTNFQRSVNLLYPSAAICAFLGEKERAYEYLRRIDGSKYRWDAWIYLVQYDPLFDNIREDEEFKLITNKVLEEHKRIREEIARAEARGEL